MKKLLLMLFIVGMAFTSCKKEEFDLETIQGKWYLFSQESIRREAGSSSIDIDTIDDRSYFMEFAQDGRFLSFEGNGRYSLANDSIYITIGNEDDLDDREPLPFRFAVSRDALTLSQTEISQDRVYEDKLHLKRLD